MEQTNRILGFDQILSQLKLHANSAQAKEMAGALRPSLSENELRKNLSETTQAAELLRELGTPPVPAMEHMEEYVERAVKGELLLPEEFEAVGSFLAAVRRLKAYLERGRQKQISLAFYSENLVSQEELEEEIARIIRGGRVDDYASGTLRDIRRRLQTLEEKIKQKAEAVLRASKAYTSDSFVVTRNGRLCIPVKKEYKSRVSGTVVEQSATGATLFIEPHSVAGLCDEKELCRIEEDLEERRILYGLLEEIAGRETELREDIRVIVKLDFVFAKGKLSMEMDAVEPSVNLNQCIRLVKARHPLLKKEECVPVDFEIGLESAVRARGVVITGPNTGGKTVAIKTVGLFSMMALSGLHLPCDEADIAMTNQILCDIGDGQDIFDNLSTFSAHICNIIEILKKVSQESLVILDELGSGTDPAEGMGIAISILEQLRQSGCLFLATTHYPEVKEYAGRHPEIVNARMAFDRESLKPLYRLEIGKSGESCALYIAKRLGLPNEMLLRASREAYGTRADVLIEEMRLKEPDGGLPKESSPRIRRHVTAPKSGVEQSRFQRGDSVMVLPDNKIGIVVHPADDAGNVCVQVQKQKILISHRRLRLKVAAAELYPEDYDFSILFDTVENRKKNHDMDRKYQPGLTIEWEPEMKQKK